MNVEANVVEIIREAETIAPIVDECLRVEQNEQKLQGKL